MERNSGVAVSKRINKTTLCLFIEFINHHLPSHTLTDTQPSSSQAPIVRPHKHIDQPANTKTHTHADRQAGHVFADS